MKKLASGTTARAVKEWIGKTPDAKVPDHVQLRVFERQKGECALTGHKFRPGDKKRLDHVLAVADGGKNRESNLWWILDAPHKTKTKAEAAVRKRVRKKAKAHAGIKAPPARPFQSRNDLATADKPKVKKLPVPRTPTELERRYGIVQPTKGKR
jgi:5-methylcytosine-specific restriction enzyme A